MPVTINGTTGISSDAGYSGDGVSFADGTPANTLVTTTGGNVGMGTSSPNTRLQIDIASGTAYSSSSNGNILRLSNTTANGYSGIMFTAEPSSGNAAVANINCFAPSSGDTVLAFGTRSGGTIAERARIDSSGNLLVGTTSNANLPGGGTSNATGIAVGSNQIRACREEYTFQIGVTNTGSSRILQQFFQAGSNCGQIVVSNSNATAYQTSSDYRLKDNPQPMVGALATVAALKPCTWTWKNSGTPGQGFIAHEVQQYFPDAVSGEKDGVDAEGNPKYQGIDTSFLVATLTAAIQELNAKVDAQAAEIAALKGIKQ